MDVTWCSMRQPIRPKLIRSNKSKHPHLRQHPRQKSQYRSRHTNPKHPPERTGRNHPSRLICLSRIGESNRLEGAYIATQQEKDTRPEGARGNDPQERSLE